MRKYLSLIVIPLLILSCSNEEGNGYTPVVIDLDIPQIFSDNIIPPVIPNDNPQTEEGIALGKRLFFDKILSNDNSIACASCHTPQSAVTDNSRFSAGVNGTLGIRNSMPLFNTTIAPFSYNHSVTNWILTIFYK